MAAMRARPFAVATEAASPEREVLLTAAAPAARTPALPCATKLTMYPSAGGELTAETPAQPTVFEPYAGLPTADAQKPTGNVMIVSTAIGPRTKHHSSSFRWIWNSPP
jgi:hypothetical protein